MSLTSEKVKEAFLVWAQENEDKRIFPEICQKDQSYYINRNSEETYMIEYSFKTIAELKKLLECYSRLAEDSEMLKSLTIAICQERYRSELDKNIKSLGKNNELYNGDKVLPEYVYTL